MIKVIAFDFVGVLANEKDVFLTNAEEKLEKMFGDNINDEDYLIEARKIVDRDIDITQITERLIDKLYKIKDQKLFKKIKDQYDGIKIVIATNHVSFVKKIIKASYTPNYLDDIIISAEIHKIKPNKEFYIHILEKFNIQPNELLFIDDNLKNIEGAKKLGINTILVKEKTNLFLNIGKLLDNNK